MMKHGIFQRMTCILLAVCVLSPVLSANAANVAGTYADSLGRTAAELESTYLGTGLTLQAVRKAAGLEKPAPLHEGQSVSAAMDAFQVVEWMNRFLDGELSRAMDHTVTLNRDLQLLNASEDPDCVQAAAGYVPVGGETLTIEDLQLTVGGYANALSEARYEIDHWSTLAESETASWEEKAWAYNRIRESYEVIREITGIVTDNHAAWEAQAADAEQKLHNAEDSLSAVGAPAGTSADVLHADACVSIVRQTVREKKSRNLGLPLRDSASHDFTVLIVHGDEFAFNVYEEQPASEPDKKKAPLGSATVQIWGYDRKKGKEITNTRATATTSDTDKSRGTTVFKLSNFSMNDKNEFELCYTVAKEGYRAQAVLCRKVEGGDIRDIYLKKEDGQGGIAGILFGDTECMYEQGSILCNVHNDEKLRSLILMGMQPGSGSLDVTVNYTDLKTKAAASKTFSFKDLSVTGTDLLTLDISDAWSSLFRFGTGDTVSVTVAGTWNGQPVSDTVKPNLDLQVAKAAAPVLTDYGVDNLVGQFMNFHWDVPKTLGLGLDVGLDNPFQNFRLTVYGSANGAIYFGIGAGATGVLDLEAEDRSTFRKKTIDDYKEDKEAFSNFKDSIKNKKSAGDKDQPAGKKNQIFGATVGVAVAACGSVEWLPTPTQSSVIRGTFEFLFAVNADMSWTFRPIAAFPPFCIRLGVGVNVGFAVHFTIYSETGVKEEDEQAVEDSFSGYLGSRGFVKGEASFGYLTLFISAKFSIFGGVDVKWFTAGLEGWLQGAVTIILSDDYGHASLDSASFGGGLAVVIKLLLVSIKFTLISGTIAKYPKDSVNLKSFRDAAAEQADITPQTETGDSATRVSLNESNFMGKIPSGGDAIKTATASGKVYGFWLTGDGVASMRLDNGAAAGEATAKLSSGAGTERVYDFAVASLEDKGLVAVAELIQDQWSKQEITVEIDGEEKQTAELEFPGAERTRMRITFYTPGSDGKLRPVANGDQSTTVTLGLGRDYYSAIDVCLTDNGTDKILGLCYWETDQNRVALYTLPLTYDADTVSFVTPLVTDETSTSPSYKQFWSDTESLGNAWTEYGSTQSLRCSFTDGKNLTAYALVLLDNREMQLPIRGEMTALVAHAVAADGGKDIVIATTEIPETVSAGFRAESGIFNTPYGIQGINVRPDGKGQDFVTATCQVLDEANSTEDTAYFNTGLTGIHMVRDGDGLKFGSYEAYDVEGMAPNAIADVSFGTYMLYWIELFNPSGNQLSEEEKASYNPESKEYAYFRMRGMLYDQANGLWTQPYTLAILDRSDSVMPVNRNVSGLRIFNDGTNSRVVLLQDTKPATEGDAGQEANVVAFNMRETMDLNFQNFTLETPAIKPGKDVNLFFTVYNDGNVPLSGFRMTVTNTVTQASLMDVEYHFDSPQAALCRVYTDTDSDGDGKGEILERTGYAAIATYTGLFEDDSASHYMTEQADASGSRRLRTASTRYLMPGGSKSFTAVFSVPNTDDSSVDLRATLTSLSTQAVRVVGSDGTGAYSAMAAWGYDLRGWEADAPASLRAGNTVTVTMDLAAGLESRDRRHAVVFGTVPVIPGLRMMSAGSAGGETFAAGPSVLGMPEGTKITPVYSAVDRAGKLLADSPAAFSRFAEVSGLDVARTAYDGVDLDIEARLRTDPDGKEMVHINVRNNAMIPAENVVINAYAASGDIPTYTVRLGKDFTLEDTWSAVVDLPLETLTAGRKVNALILRASSDGTEATDGNNETILNLGDAFRLTEQPQDLTVLEGASASFSVAARGGVKPYTWQWQTCLSGSSAWKNIEGATGSTLTLEKTAMDDNGRLFRCVAMDDAGSRLVSDAACLTVQKVPKPPMTGDPADPAGWLLTLLLSCAVILLLRRRGREGTR